MRTQFSKTNAAGVNVKNQTSERGFFFILILHNHFKYWFDAAFVHLRPPSNCPSSFSSELFALYYYRRQHR